MIFLRVEYLLSHLPNTLFFALWKQEIRHCAFLYCTTTICNTLWSWIKKRKKRTNYHGYNKTKHSTITRPIPCLQYIYITSNLVWWARKPKPKPTAWILNLECYKNCFLLFFTISLFAHSILSTKRTLHNAPRQSEVDPGLWPTIAYIIRHRTNISEITPSRVDDAFLFSNSKVCVRERRR